MPAIDISIIIPCYNDGRFLDSALQSITAAAGNYAYEVIIVNDGSTDSHTIEKLTALKAKGILVIEQAQQGLGAARNKGIAVANGKYILPLDSDNLLLPPYLNAAIDYLELQATCSVVYSAVEFFGEKTAIWSPGEFNLQRLMLYNYIDACAVYRKELWTELNGYDAKMPVMGVEDWDFWLRAAFKGKEFHFLNEVGYKYRYRADSLSRSWTMKEYNSYRQFIEQKHRQFISSKHVYDFFMYGEGQRRKTILQLCFQLYFPRLFKWLNKTGLIKADKSYIR
ncbi:MAG: hypothetical protein RIR12_1407 [Bacteroidota bacterium]|jgi:glycosyltransferase involved in cell wall biosynthesis